MPRRRHRSLIDVRLSRSWMSARASVTALTRWGGRVSNWLLLSIAQSRNPLFVDHAASPWNWLLTKIGSLRWESDVVLGWKILSMVVKGCHIICWSFVCVPWSTDMSSLRSTSMQARSLTCWYRVRESHVVSSLAVEAPVSSFKSVAAAVLRGWGGSACFRAMVLLSISMAVYVVVQNKAEPSMYPMGRAR